MLGAIAGVAESFLAAGVLAQVRLLSCVAPQVDLQVLQARERFVAALKLWNHTHRGKKKRGIRHSEVLVQRRLSVCVHL